MEYKMHSEAKLMMNRGGEQQQKRSETGEGR